MTTIWADGTVFRRMYARNFDKRLPDVPPIAPDFIDLSEFGL